jgi:acetyl-CoA carboxylase biotin carboxyl carrier protein
MDLQYLKKLIRLLEHSGIDEIEVEEEGVKIRVSKNSLKSGGQPIIISGGAMPASVPSAVPAASSAPAGAEAPADKGPVGHEVRSPIVGTFYRAPAPDADSYVEVGQVVEKGTILCIIEAMKLMNEIESDVAGRITKVCVDNAKPVEYNQPLFIIEPV